MKREIQFRGKSLKGYWLYGQVHIYGDGTFICNDKLQSGDGSGYKVISEEVDEKTVGQFTGLKDKNGDVIYEGDIVRWATFNPERPFIDEPVEYHFGSFNPVSELSINDIEIIGNVYDNNELLNSEIKI